MKTILCDLIGIEYPIFQGGMAWVSDYSLAAAVSEAGGLGIISAGNAPADYVRDQIRRTRELTDKPFGVNIMLLTKVQHRFCLPIIECFVILECRYFLTVVCSTKDNTVSE